MTVERIREIQRATAYPDSVTMQQALLQVWNEVAQEMFTKEQVEELLKKQRELCARELIYFFKDNGENWNNETDIIRNAPSPSLQQLKEQHNELNKTRS